MSKFFNPSLSGLAPYVPGEQPQERKYIKLNTNENPYPPSPQVLETIAREAERLRLYPDPSGTCLHRAIGAHYALEEDQVLAANGSDEILAFSFLAFSTVESGIICTDITYGFYAVWAELFERPVKRIPLKEDFTIDVNGFCGEEATIFLANPNAQTGIALSLFDIEQILQSHRDRIVVVDEAYVDFGAESAAALIDRYDNLLVIQTYSKSRSLAGGRLGFALGQRELIDDLNRIKFSFNPYNVNRLTMAAGIAAMEDDHYFQSCCERVIATRERTAASLSSLGCSVLPSHANFMMVKNPSLDGETYYRALRERGILVRWFNEPRIAAYVRITIGSNDEMAALIAATEDIMKGAR